MGRPSLSPWQSKYSLRACGLTLPSRGLARARRATLVHYFPLRAPCPREPLMSNVRHLSVPSVKTPPVLVALASPVLEQGGLASLQRSARSCAKLGTATGLAARTRGQGSRLAPPSSTLVANSSAFAVFKQGLRVVKCLTRYSSGLPKGSRSMPTLGICQCLR